MSDSTRKVLVSVFSTRVILIFASLLSSIGCCPDLVDVLRKGLDWKGLVWKGLERIGKDWKRLERIGKDWKGLERIRLDCVNMYKYWRENIQFMTRHPSGPHCLREV